MLIPTCNFNACFKQVWCEISTPEALLGQVLGDPHSPGRFRVVSDKPVLQLTTQFKPHHGDIMVTLLRLFSLFLMRTFAQIGPVGNSEDFQTAYGCPADSAMNRHKQKLNY